MNDVILKRYELVYDIMISNITELVQLFDVGFCIHLPDKDIVIVDMFPH